MAIQNKKPKPKASAKTDAMKALNAAEEGSVGEDSAGETAASAPPVPRPVMAVRPAAAPPTPSKPLPPQAPTVVVPPRPLPRPAAEETPEAAPEREKIAFDPQVWQWRDQGGFIHTKTGELREETDFLDPDERPGDARDNDWDAPQESREDW